MSGGAGDPDNRPPGRNRARIGFDDMLDTGPEADPERAAPDFDPAEWAPETRMRPRPETAATRAAADATGFRSREAAPETKRAVPAPSPAALSNTTLSNTVPSNPAPHPVPPAAPAVVPRRRRTGRNTQFNLKARPDIIARFCAVADANGWGLGETLEYAVVLLERDHGGNG